MRQDLHGFLRALGRVGAQEVEHLVRERRLEVRQRLAQCVDAVRGVYASAMSEEALAYRQAREVRAIRRARAGVDAPTDGEPSAGPVTTDRPDDLSTTIAAIGSRPRSAPPPIRA